jgi:translin
LFFYLVTPVKKEYRCCEASKMDLEKILESIKVEIETDDGIRERTLPLAREAVRKCGESVKQAHKGEFSDATRLLQESRELMIEAADEISHSEFMSASRVLDAAYQEMAEAANVVSLLKDSTFVPPDEIGIPSRPYLTGLADAVGELRRAALDSLRIDNTERAERLLELMDETLEGLLAFDFPNALIPDLRRKCDVARSLVERTRGDLTAGVQQMKLVGELRKFEEHIKDGRKR